MNDSDLKALLEETLALQRRTWKQQVPEATLRPPVPAATGEAPLFWMDLRGDVAELEGFEAFLLAQLQFQQDVLEE